MDTQSPGLKFAAIGHQDNWDKVLRFVNTMRDSSAVSSLSLEQIKEVYGFIPPRSIFDVSMESAITGTCEGVYIETFISPDELDAKHLRYNLDKVKEACQYAASLKIPVVSLGGFSSIILENSGCPLTHIGDTFFTTGNTLTAAFIVEGVEKACRYWNQSLQHSTVLVIGATGDIGSACSRYFAEKAKGLLLCARQPGPLQQLATSLKGKATIECSTDMMQLMPKADIVIGVASSILDNCNLSLLPPHAIICDAGYPKNIYRAINDHERRIFSGGMGIVERGYRFDPDYTDDLYRFAVKNAVHGCLLEAIVLAMEGIPKAYSTGRGNITIAAMEYILGIAANHGVVSAPLFSSEGVCELTEQNYQHERA